MNSKKDRIVYILFRSWNGIPCYVGKGAYSQPLRHQKWGMKHENRHLARIFAKAGGVLPFVVVREGLTTEEANEVEIAFIKAIGRADKGLGPLTNHTDGGEGALGALGGNGGANKGQVRTVAQRQNIAQGKKGQRL